VNKRTLLTAVLLAAVAWAIYLPSIRYDFVYYDDVRVLRDHPELYGQPRLTEDFRAIFVTGFPREEPLLIRDATWALDSRIFGFGNPFGYHLGNVLLHGVVVALVFIFLFGTTGRYGFALATAGAYLLLGLHTEPVAWIMGRKDILSALFMLLALCAQTRRLQTASRRARISWFIAALLCFVLALMSKISVLSFPLVLFLHAVFFTYLRGERPPEVPFFQRNLLVREGLLVLPSLVISGAVYVWYQRTLEQMGIFDRGYAARGLAHLWNLFVIDPCVFWVYVRQTFLPARLHVIYTWPDLMTRYPGWQVAVAIATVSGLIAIGIWLFRRRKDLFFFYAAFFVLMVPYINLIYVGIWLAERYLYFSSLCLLALVVSAGLAMLRHRQALVRAAVLALTLVFAGMNVYQTICYQPTWRNAETLWQYHLTLPHPAPTAFENLAAYYYAQVTAHRQDLTAASINLKKMEVVVDAGLNEFWPDRSQPAPQAVYHILFLEAIVQEIRGDLEGALNSLLTSSRLRPEFQATNLNLARLYHKLAATTTDSAQKRTYACAARDRFAQYLSRAFRGRSWPPELEQERLAMEAGCPASSNQPVSAR
jgi:hypothetical protein